MPKGDIVSLMVGWYDGINVNLVLDHGLDEFLIEIG